MYLVSTNQYGCIHCKEKQQEIMAFSSMVSELRVRYNAEMLIWKRLQADLFSNWEFLNWNEEKVC